MKHLVTILGRVIMISSILFLGYTTYQNFDRFPSIHPGSSFFFAVGFSLLITVVLNIMGGIIWKYALAISNLRIPFRLTIHIFLVSQLAKYMPGNVFHFVGRTVMGKLHGIHTSTTIASLFIETIAVITVAALIGFSGLFFDPTASSIAGAQYTFFLGDFNLTLIGVFIFIVITVGIYLYINHKERTFQKVFTYLRESRFTPNAYFIFILYFLSFALMAGILFVLQREFFPGIVTISWYQYFWRFSLSWIIGFLVPGAPGGIGVREAVFLLLFQDTLGEANSIGLVFAQRMIMTFGDLLSFSAGRLFKPEPSISSPG